MSGLEIAAFVVGILGPLQQAAQAAILLRNNSNRRSRNANSIASALAASFKLIQRLQQLSGRCINLSSYLSKQERDVFIDDITTIYDNLQLAIQSLRALERDQNRPLLRRFLPNSLIEEKCEAQKNDVRILSKRIDRIQAFVLTCETLATMTKVQSEALAQQMGRIIERQSVLFSRYVDQVAADVRNEVRQNLYARAFHVSAPQESFKPSFYIGRYISYPWLAFETVDKYGNRSTSEYRLKKAVLTNSVERLHGSCRSPVVVASGAGGIGKGAALLGLSTDPHIRRHFAGGVYFIYMGRYATDLATRRQLARIVRLSGGAWVSQEIGAADNLLLAVGMTMKWFKGKDCLFLIRGVCLNERSKAIFPLLAKLGQDSGPRSTIAVSSKYRFDYNDVGKAVTMAHREPLGQFSRQILLCSAQISEMEIHQYCVVHRQAFERVLSLCSGMPLLLTVTGQCILKLSRLWSHDHEGIWETFLKLRANPSSPIEIGSNGRTLLQMIIEELTDVWLQHNMDVDIFKRLRALCVLTGYKWVSYNTLKRLWEFDSAYEAKETARYYSLICLMECERERVWIRKEVLEFALKEASQRGEVEFWRTRLEMHP